MPQELIKAILYVLIGALVSTAVFIRISSSSSYNSNFNMECYSVIEEQDKIIKKALGVITQINEQLETLEFNYAKLQSKKSEK